MFRRKQLIQQVLLLSYNHCYMTLGFDAEAGEKLDKQVTKLLWTQEEKSEIKKKRTMVAKKRIGLGYEFGGLQIQTAEEIATGLGCNFIQRAMKNNNEEKKLFMTTRLNDLLVSQGLPNLGGVMRLEGNISGKKHKVK